MVASQVELDTKTCSKCKVTKPLSEFHLNSSQTGGRHWWCKTCRKSHSFQYREGLKALVYDHYGRECSCCGEDEILFLSIDHTKNDGAEHRRTLAGNKSISLYKYLIENNFPSDFQIMCSNCNRGRWMNGGICPHKEAK